ARACRQAFLLWSPTGSGQTGAPRLMRRRRVRRVWNDISSWPYFLLRVKVCENSRLAFTGAVAVAGSAGRSHRKLHWDNESISTCRKIPPGHLRTSEYWPRMKRTIDLHQSVSAEYEGLERKHQRLQPQNQRVHQPKGINDMK